MVGEIIAALHTGVWVEPSKQSLAEFTAGSRRRADDPAGDPAQLRPGTSGCTSSRLGSVQLCRVDAGMLNGLYATLLADRDGALRVAEIIFGTGVSSPLAKAGSD